MTSADLRTGIYSADHFDRGGDEHQAGLAEGVGDSVRSVELLWCCLRSSGVGPIDSRDPAGLRLTQIMNPLNLASGIQEAIQLLSKVEREKGPVTEQQLRSIVAELD